MLMNVFVFWILMSVFAGRREADRVFGAIFAMFVCIWAIRMIVGMSIGLLPLIVLAVLFSRVIRPFVKGFLSSFRYRR